MAWKMLSTAKTGSDKVQKPNTYRNAPERGKRRKPGLPVRTRSPRLAAKLRRTKAGRILCALIRSESQNMRALDSHPTSRANSGQATVPRRCAGQQYEHCDCLKGRVRPCNCASPATLLKACHYQSTRSDSWKAFVLLLRQARAGAGPVPTVSVVCPCWFSRQDPCQRRSLACNGC